MKKIILTLAIGLSALSLSAQDGFQLGVKAGFTSTQYTTENITTPTTPDISTIEEDAKAGYLLGAYSRFKLIGNLSLQPELYYAKKSGETEITTKSGSTTTTETGELTYYTWDIPILAHLTLVDLKTVKLYGITGPVVSFNAKNDNTFPSVTNQDEKTNSAVWNYQLGAGVELWKLNFDVRYEWGLSNVSDGISDITFDRKSNMLTFAAAWRLF